MKKLTAAALLAAALSASPACAQSAFQGFHVGVNAGPTMTDVELTDFGTKYDLATQGFVGGGSLGYMFAFSQGWLFDIEGFVDYAKSEGNSNVFVPTSGGLSQVKLSQGLGYGIAGSVGYMITPVNAVYGKLGYEMRDFKAGISGFADQTKSIGGFQIGAGTRWALDGNWSLKAEYLYTLYATTDLGAGVSVKPSSNTFRIGADFRFY